VNPSKPYVEVSTKAGQLHLSLLGRDREPGFADVRDLEREPP